MDNTKSNAPSAHTSTRQHRVDGQFLELLEYDFLIAYPELVQAFGGVPATPKKLALAICFWAADHTADPGERGRMVRAWAKKNGHGYYRASQHDEEPPTFGGYELSGV